MAISQQNYPQISLSMLYIVTTTVNLEEQKIQLFTTMISVVPARYCSWHKPLTNLFQKRHLE